VGLVRLAGGRHLRAAGAKPGQRISAPEPGREAQNSALRAVEW
jgi:hypothetical protein